MRAVHVWAQMLTVGSVIPGRQTHNGADILFSRDVLEALVRRWSDTGSPQLAIDDNYASQRFGSDSIPKEGVPAQGWVYGLEYRGDHGLWAHARLEDSGIALVRRAPLGAYLVPALNWGEHPRLISAAITREPLDPTLQPIELAGEP